MARQICPNLGCVSRQSQGEQPICSSSHRARAGSCAGCFSHPSSERALWGAALRRGVLFRHPPTRFSEKLVNGPSSLCGQPFHTLHFNLLFLMNTCFRWHLFWQIFGPQPGTRGYGPAEELSHGSKPQLVRTTLGCSRWDIPALGRKAVRQCCGCSSPCCPFLCPCILRVLSPGAGRGVWWGQLALLCCWRSSLALSRSLQGITRLLCLSALNGSELGWRMGLWKACNCCV